MVSSSAKLYIYAMPEFVVLPCRFGRGLFVIMMKAAMAAGDNDSVAGYYIGTTQEGLYYALYSTDLRE